MQSLDNILTNTHTCTILVLNARKTIIFRTSNKVFNKILLIFHVQMHVHDYNEGQGAACRTELEYTRTICGL